MTQTPSLLNRFILVTTLIVAAPSFAAAAEYVVAPGGADSATGLSGAPWRTLQKAIDAVKAGDVVAVEDGSYAGLACDGVSGTANARIVIRSRNRWGAKINAATSQSTQDFVQFASCSYITFDGFEVSGAPRSGIAILGDTEDGSDARGVIIQNCFSHDNGGTSASGRHDGIFSGFALDLTIQDNRIDTTGEHGIYVSNAADNPSILRNDISNTGANCIQINADLSTGGDGLISNWRIEGNTIRNCKGAAAINLDGAIRGVARNNVVFGAAKAGFTLFQGDGAEASHDNLIVNNTVYNPKGSRAAIQLADGANNNIIFNNIFISQATAFEVQTVTGLQHDYNIVSSFDGSTASAHETTPTSAASLFADAANGDLRLATPAPAAALDQGVATFAGAQAPVADVLGAARPAGAGYDLGAYESGATPTGGTGGTGGSSSNAGGVTGTSNPGGTGGTRVSTATGGAGGTRTTSSSAGGAGGTRTTSVGSGGRGGTLPTTGGSTGSAGSTGNTGGTKMSTGEATAGAGGAAGGSPIKGSTSNLPVASGGNGQTGTLTNGTGGTSGGTGKVPASVATPDGGGTDEALSIAGSGCACRVTAAGASPGIGLVSLVPVFLALVLRGPRRRR
jgi:MYXO-CTERM domain-containing protein